MSLKHTNQKSIARGQAPIAQTYPNCSCNAALPGKRIKKSWKKNKETKYTHIFIVHWMIYKHGVYFLILLHTQLKRYAII